MFSLRSLTPMLETDSINDTIQFYNKVLGFTLSETWEHESELKWASLYKDNTWLMFATRNTHRELAQPIVTRDLYFYPDDVNAVWEAVNDKCEIVYPIENFSYGMREFAIKDNNGYILKFGKSIDTVSQYDIFFSSTFILETPRVILRLLQLDDYAAFLPITKDQTIWNYFTKDLSGEEELRKWITEALNDRANCKRMPFTIIDKHDKQICGSTSFGNISFFDKRVEIGWSWLGTNYMSTGVNRHAKFALLSYAFEVMNMERVEVKTDNQNARAKAALIKIGMKPEGVLRSHMQMHSDRRRDSIYYSILKNEWPEVKQQFFGELL